MDLSEDKGQTEYQVVSVFRISVVFATLDTEGTANLRDTPNPTPPPPPQPQKAVGCHCFTLTTKVANWKDRAHKLEYAPTASKGTDTSPASKGQQNAVQGGSLENFAQDTGNLRPGLQLSGSLT